MLERRIDGRCSKHAVFKGETLFEHLSHDHMLAGNRHFLENGREVYEVWQKQQLLVVIVFRALFEMGDFFIQARTPGAEFAEVFFVRGRLQLLVDHAFFQAFDLLFYLLQFL